MSVFVNRFRKDFWLDTSIYWMTEWDSSVDERGNQIYSSAKLFKLTEGSLKRQKMSHPIWFRLISVWPICTHICIKWFIILMDILFLTNLSSKLSSSLLSKLEKFFEFSWHNPRHFEEYKAVDYRSCIPLLLLSTFILRHCCQTPKKYVCVQYNRWKLSVD